MELHTSFTAGEYHPHRPACVDPPLQGHSDRVPESTAPSSSNFRKRALPQTPGCAHSWRSGCGTCGRGPRLGDPQGGAALQVLE